MLLHLSFSHPSLSDLKLSSSMIAMAGLREAQKASSRSLYFSPVSSGRRTDHRADSKLLLPRFFGWRTRKDKHLLKHCKIEIEEKGMEILS